MADEEEEDARVSERVRDKGGVEGVALSGGGRGVGVREGGRGMRIGWGMGVVDSMTKGR